MDLSDYEEFYDSDDSDVGEQSLRTMLQNTFCDDNNVGYDNEFEEQIASEEITLGSVQEEIIDNITNYKTPEESLLGTVQSNTENEREKIKNVLASDTLIAKTVDDTEKVNLDSNVLEDLETQHFGELYSDNFEPLSKIQKLSHENNKNNGSPHNTVTMDASQFIRCPMDGHNSIKIENILCGANMGCPLDLLRIVMWTNNSEYNPQRFNGLIIRLRVPKITALLFSTGKIIVQGAKNDWSGNLGCQKIAKILERLGHDVKFSDYKIHNIICSWDVGFPIMLDELNAAHSQFTSFEPEIFPALIYRMVSPRGMLLIFVNGKIILTGLKTKADIKECVFLMHDVLKFFIKKK